MCSVAAFVSAAHENDHVTMLPNFCKVVKILAVIPATFCLAIFLLMVDL